MTTGSGLVNLYQNDMYALEKTFLSFERTAYNHNIEYLRDVNTEQYDHLERLELYIEDVVNSNSHRNKNEKKLMDTATT